MATTVTVLAQHAPQAPRLQQLLGEGFIVQGQAALPAEGPIVTDVLVTTRLTAQEAPRLQARLLQAPGAGLDAIALDALPAHCRVCNVYEHEIPIAEFVTRAVLDWVIFPEGDRFAMDAAHWAATYRGRAVHGEAFGRRAAIVGFGAIGQATAARLRALGLHVTAVTRHARLEPGADATHPVADLAALLPAVDVLVLCCPLNDSSRGLVGARELAGLRSDALLVNVGRAELVQPQPLYETLQARRLGRAVLDVWYRYPTPDHQGPLEPAEFPLTQLPNVRSTPHVSGWTHGLLERRYAFMARNIARLAAGEPLHNQQR
ncbi:2-hydroxyacid dehydrogenase [Xylophilus sp.]|uniref:2-hydroxyacid dehydrogenase n=1 Tax=Xylophilus sp. TaxID=2653893 RepID=UPI0013BCEEEB|nr:2-hydroxyacid dehydrogenase [Xylophilus sp.]KAF1049228.1 MAG: D-3-phosphoglycerate dehydrogenase [Xylophilus sp.]